MRRRIGSLRYHVDDGHATKMSLKKWIRVLSISIAIIPTRLLCQMQANSSEAEFLRTVSRFTKRKKISSLLVNVLHKKREIRQFHVVVVQKCTKNVMHGQCCCFTSVGSLSSTFFERRTSTGSEPFSLLICLDATKFVLLTVFTLVEMICPNFCSKSQLKCAKSPLCLTRVAQKRCCLSSLLIISNPTWSNFRMTLKNGFGKCLLLLLYISQWIKRSKHGLFVFPPESKRHCSIGQSCCSMTSRRSIGWFLESSRAWSFLTRAFA